MLPLAEHRARERENWDFFLSIPELDRDLVEHDTVKGSQLLEPLFEFSGACAGCGETPYLKLLTQLFGDRVIVANATGCSSIYGGNLPTTPWAANAEGRGPAWSNSLFEDNAEFGLGLQMGLGHFHDEARRLVRAMRDEIDPDLADQLLDARQDDERGIDEQRVRVAQLKRRLVRLHGRASADARRLLSVADDLVRKSVWIVGGDGWAYDIGFGGLDHVLASGRNVNILVLDTEVYSNTGGQCSKSTPRSAVAKFAAGGKPVGKKDLGLIAMSYGHVYVGSVALGARDEHTLRTFLEAESYDGPSLIIAYSHCIAHGINMTTAMQNQKTAVATGQWLLYRYDPRRAASGENPLQLDSRAPTKKVEEYLLMENRFKMLTKSKPADAKILFGMAQEDVENRYRLYEFLAGRKTKPDATAVAGAAGAQPGATTVTA
jgi:pyruvate-ferredoxin/flavodoxin oxidoreductase